MKLTKHRKEILNLLENSHTTLSASDIHQHLPHINLVTIYRTLEIFTTENLVKKMYFHSDEALYEIMHQPHHHAICVDCEAVKHFEVDEKALKKVFNLKDFDISDVEIVIKGHCHSQHPIKK